MFKKTSLLALLLCFSAVVAAQNLHFKVGGGVASRYADSRVVGSYKIGIGYEHELGLKWSVLPGIYVQAKGWKDRDRSVLVRDDEGNQVFDEEGKPITGVMNTTTTANYFTLPVLFNYYLRTGESRYFVFSAGPYLACGVSGKMKTKGDAERVGSEKLYHDRSTFSSDGLCRFDAGVEAAIGYQFPHGITLAVEADFGLMQMKSGFGRSVSGIITLAYTIGTRD